MPLTFLSALKELLNGGLCMVCAGDIFAWGGGVSLNSQLSLLCLHTQGGGEEVADSQEGGVCV